MVSLLYEFDRGLLGLYYFDNICHILCTCICLYECSYVDANRADMKNVSHIHHMNTASLHCEFCCAQQGMMM